MMRIYVASRFERQVELQGYAAQLRASGHKVTSRWLIEEADEVGAPSTWLGHADRLRKYAGIDLEDIEDCDTFMVFTHEGMARGGMHVEFGYALALGKRIIVVGPRPTLFHYLSRVLQFDDWASAARSLGVSP